MTVNPFHSILYNVNGIIFAVFIILQILPTWEDTYQQNRDNLPIDSIELLRQS